MLRYLGLSGILSPNLEHGPTPLSLVQSRVSITVHPPKPTTTTVRQHVCLSKVDEIHEAAAICSAIYARKCCGVTVTGARQSARSYKRPDVPLKGCPHLCIQLVFTTQCTDMIGSAYTCTVSCTSSPYMALCDHKYYSLRSHQSTRW